MSASKTGSHEGLLPWQEAKTWKEGPLPSYKELPEVHGLKNAWKVWSPEEGAHNDVYGCLNLLTPERVAGAAKEIKTGEVVSLNLPIQIPAKPAFHRRHAECKILANHGAENPVRDDELHINSQSGSQWDSFRHFGVLAGGCFYGGMKADLVLNDTIIDATDPMSISREDIKMGVQNFANHTISGRGVLVDLVTYYLGQGSELPYDPCTTHAIPLKDIRACAKQQGTTFQTGDILILRVGWTRRYLTASQAEREEWSHRKDEAFAGIENTEEVREWLWDNHFAAVASDMPAFECWPPKLQEGEHFLHETIIGSFGSPIGEFVDCEKLSRVCEKLGRYTFFFSSNPLCILGGAATTLNASAIF